MVLQMFSDPKCCNPGETADKSTPVTCIAGWVFLLVLVSLTSACSFLASPSIVRPNFETETIKLREGNYKLDPDHSTLLFKIGHLNLATYVGRFNQIEASLEFDPKAIEDTVLEGIVEVASIDTNNAEFDSLLVGSDWFDAEQYPQARFVSTGVEPVPLDDGRIQLAVEGELTLRGVTRPVSMTATFNGGADNLLTRKYTLGFSATGSFMRSDFGIAKFPGLVSEQVDLEFFAEFQRQ